MKTNKFNDDVLRDEKGKVIKCVDSYNQGVSATTPSFTRSEYL